MLGQKQTLVLDVIFRAGSSAYGAGIAKLLEEQGAPTALPQIYSILEKLDRMGLVQSSMSSPTPERGGRRKRIYRVTGLGENVLRERLNDIGGFDELPA